MLPPDNSHLLDWQNFITAAVHRYPQAIGVEVWNEPNLRTFWASGPDPVRYVTLLRLAHDAVKQAAPSMLVISGGLGNAPTTTTLGDISYSDFLQRLYTLQARPYWDAIGIHPYPAQRTPDGSSSYFLLQLRNLRAVRDQQGDNSRFWITEWGIFTGNATDGFGQPPASEANQALWIECAYQMTIGMPDIDAFLSYTTRDLANDLNNPEDNFGLFHFDETAKAAADTMHNLFVKYGANVPAVTSCASAG
jgi:hypothetical protein